jgi:hypothetical protein
MLAGDGGGEQAESTSDAAGQAALRGVALQEKQYALEEPYRKKLVDAGISGIDRAETISGKQLPLQLTVIDEATVAGSPWEQAQAAGRATADTHAAIDSQAGARARSLASLGIKPGDAAYTAGARAADATNAASLAAAATNAREAERVRGINTRMSVAGTGFPTYNPNVPQTSASSITSSAGNLASSQQQVANGRNSMEMDLAGTVGKAVGSISERVFAPSSSSGGGGFLSGLFGGGGGAFGVGVNPLGGGGGPTAGLAESFMPASFREGGPVRRLRYASGGDVVDAEIVSTAPSGPVEGPKHEQGGVPIEAEGGEFIIKASSTAKYGPKLLSEVNDGTAIIIPTASPRRLKLAA